ncbi:MAG: carboxypeptidase regulatory-like domain-containing protein [Deltaproteobacteria bacterium]|nr:carboxypeptidase regulatory-like domain-containing protein [Deltaproteobacteria bacterium]
MKARTFAIGIICALALAGCGGGGGGGGNQEAPQKTTVTGRSLDSNGHPVPGATITVSGDPVTAQTGSDGSFVADIVVGEHELTAEKSGHAFCRQHFVALAGTPSNLGDVAPTSPYYDGGVSWYADPDGDGYGSGVAVTDDTRPAGYFLPSELTSTTGDCNDADPTVYPDALEVCGDGIDNDCSGLDEPCGSTWYRDSDGDGYSDGATLTQEDRPGGYFLSSELAAVSGDCNDADPAVHPGAAEVCGDRTDQDCNGFVDDGCPVSVAPAGQTINVGRASVEFCAGAVVVETPVVIGVAPAFTAPLPSGVTTVSEVVTVDVPAGALSPGTPDEPLTDRGLIIRVPPPPSEAAKKARRAAALVGDSYWRTVAPVVQTSVYCGATLTASFLTDAVVATVPGLGLFLPSQTLEAASNCATRIESAYVDLTDRLTAQAARRGDGSLYRVTFDSQGGSSPTLLHVTSEAAPSRTGKAALVLVHGWNKDTLDDWYSNEDDVREYWREFLSFFSTSTDLAETFDLYGFTYFSADSIEANGERLLKMLDSGAPLARYDQVVVLAHSMGGLVTRSALELTDASQFVNPAVKDKVKRVVTLATPHHGSVLGNREWQRVPMAGAVVALPFWGRLGSEVAFLATATRGARDLNWDGFDGRFTAGLTALEVPVESRFTHRLNEHPDHNDRIRAYFGWFTEGSHPSYRLTGNLMSASGYESDGAVPTVSGRAQDVLATGATRWYDDFDHSQMKADKGPASWPLFERVKCDLLEAAPGSYPAVQQAPTAAPQGAMVTQSGSGFTPNSRAELHFQRPDGSEFAPQVQPIGAQGTFSIPYLIPADRPLGTYTWWGVDGVTGAQSESVSYTVTQGGTVSRVWFRDSDGDGYPDGSSVQSVERPVGYAALEELRSTDVDCDDATATVNPASQEVFWNGVDDDCSEWGAASSGDAIVQVLSPWWVGETTANGINEAGSVAGTACNSLGQARAWIWTPRNGLIDLGTLGGVTSYAAAIGARDVVVGQADNRWGLPRAFVWTPDTGIRDLGTLAGDTTSTAIGIGDTGYAVGRSLSSTGRDRAVFWNLPRGTTASLPGLAGGDENWAAAVTGAGAVAGSSDDASGWMHAVLWKYPNVLDLGTFGLDAAMAWDVNSDEMVVGDAVDSDLPEGEAKNWGLYQSFICGDQPSSDGWRLRRAFRWHEGTSELLPLGGGVSSSARAVNSSGNIVGTVSFGDGTTHAFLWGEGEPVDLNSLVAIDSGWVLVAASDINSRGQIVGQGLLNGQRRAFLLSPIR